MPDDDIYIRPVKVAELVTFADRYVAGAKSGDFIPITLHRAQAMAHNPYAAPDDVALLAAYSGEQLIGYFGIMAVKLDDGEKQYKAHWFTTWMVDPRFLGRGVGSKLMQTALDLDKDFFIVGSKPARRVCDKFGFERLPEYGYVRLDFGLVGRYNPVSLLLRLFRKVAYLFGARLDIQKASQRAELFFEGLLGWLLRPLLYALAMRKAKGGDYRFEKVGRVRKVDDHTNKRNVKPRLVRGTEVVNWMLAYPWVLPPGTSPTEGMDFYFSDTRPHFEIWALEARHDGYCGFVAFQFSLTRGVRLLKVLDVDTRPGDEGFVLQAALAEGMGRRAEQIEMAPQHAAVLDGSFIGRLLIRRKKRIYQVHPRAADSPLARVKDHLLLQYTDGDTPFT